MEIKPTKGQIDDLMDEIKKRVGRGRALPGDDADQAMAEELADYLQEMGIKTHYLHSEMETLERVEICATCAWASMTSSSASTCCGRASTCRR